MGMMHVVCLRTVLPLVVIEAFLTGKVRASAYLPPGPTHASAASSSGMPAGYVTYATSE